MTENFLLTILWLKLIGLVASEGATIGIDFGTSFTRFGVFEKDEFKLLGEFPNRIEFKNDGRCLIGIDEPTTDPENTVTSPKRLIGRNFKDDNFQNYIKQLPFSLEENNHNISVNIYIDDKLRKITIESIITRIFNKIKKICTEKLNTDVINAVVTVPSYFNPVQREFLKNAIDKSGVNLLKFINEAIAVSIAYSRKNKLLGSKKVKNILIIDIGSGKLEVNIVEIIDSKIFYQVIVKGDNDFGGEDLNDKIIEHYIKLIKRKFPNIRNNKIAVQKLRKEIETAKLKLSTESEVKITIDNLIENYNFSNILTIENFETLNKNLFQRFSRSILSVLKDAQEMKLDISEVVLAGGSTRLNLLNKILDKLILSKLGYKIPIIEMNKYVDSRNLAFGAAYLINNDIGTFNIIPSSLGFRKDDGEFEKLIDKDSFLPLKKSRLIKLKDCNNLLVYSGESFISNENDFLLKFDLKNIRNKQKCNVLVTFELDGNSILNISVVEKVPNENTKAKEEAKKIEEKYEPLTSEGYEILWTFYIILFFVIFGFVYTYCVTKYKENERRKLQDLEARRRQEEIRYTEQLATIRATILDDFIRRMIAAREAQNIQAVPPASQEQVGRIFVVNIDQSIVDNNEKCSICTDVFFLNEQATHMPNCSHLFHKMCLETWLRESASCPNCRSIF